MMASAPPISVASIIRAQKLDVRVGAWEVGSVPKAKFPLIKNKLSLGRGWKWRIVTFSALSEQFVVLVALSEEKESYRAVLAMKSEKSLKVLCFHELHTDHWNWHCHFIRGNVHDTYAGVLRDKNLMTAWPKFSTSKCTVPFEVTEDSALTIAAARYKFAEVGGLL
jgi:hypothetical protein